MFVRTHACGIKHNFEENSVNNLSSCKYNINLTGGYYNINIIIIMIFRFDRYACTFVLLLRHFLGHVNNIRIISYNVYYILMYKLTPSCSITAIMMITTVELLFLCKKKKNIYYFNIVYSTIQLGTCSMLRCRRFYDK